MASLKSIKLSLNKYRVSLSLLAILILALGLRVHTVLTTEVIAPFRSDAGEYFFYAYNLKHHGTFSKSPHGYSQNKAPKPDAYRTPGYPLFLALFVDGKVTAKMFTHILVAQAFLSTLVVYLTYLFSRTIFPVPQALIISFLTAISPHLININVYILSEALFSFVVVVFFWSLSRIKESFSPKMFLILGILLGLASLVRPVAQYFVIPMIIISFLSCGFRKGGQLAAVILTGYFLVFGSWMARNLSTLGVVSDNYVKYATIKFGLYPGLMYQDDPKTLGYPYHFDPNASNVKPELGSILKEVKRRFTTEPVRHLKWYGYEKGIMLWSWNMVVGEGEYWVYPVTSSPYMDNPLFTITSQLMKILHWPLVLLGLAGTCMAWMPRFTQAYGSNQIFFIRVLSFFLIYYTLIHILSFAIPRYTIPIRPLLYSMAFVPILHLSKLIQRKPKLNPQLVDTPSIGT